MWRGILQTGEEYFKLERITSYLKYSSPVWWRGVLQITIWTEEFGIKLSFENSYFGSELKRHRGTHYRNVKIIFTVDPWGVIFYFQMLCFIPISLFSFRAYYVYSKCFVFQKLRRVTVFTKICNIYIYNHLTFSQFSQVFSEHLDISPQTIVTPDI